MRRLLYLAALSVVAALVFAPAALAQQGGSPFCPEGGFFATAPGDPGEGSGTCFQTQEAAEVYSNTGEIPPGSVVPQEQDSSAGAREGQSSPEATECPAGQVNVLLDSGEFICVPANIEDQTPSQIRAVVNDPRSNAETPVVENQDVDPSQLTAAQRQAAGLTQQPTAEQTQPAQDQQPQQQDDQMQGLPDTGGPALLLPIAGLLVGSGIFGLFVARRRTS